MWQLILIISLLELLGLYRTPFASITVLQFSWSDFTLHRQCNTESYVQYHCTQPVSQLEGATKGHAYCIYVTSVQVFRGFKPSHSSLVG